MGTDSNAFSRGRQRAPSGAGGFSRGLELLARRLLRDQRTLTLRVVARARDDAELREEDPRFEDAVAHALPSLIEAIALGRRELAELHATGLFSELSALGFDLSAAQALVTCLTAATTLALPSDDYREHHEELSAFLRAAAGFVAGSNESDILQSTERPRRLPLAARPTLVGESAAMQQLRAELRDVARAPGAVLVVGESGTGKELVAESLHQLATPRQRPFMAINCAALPRELIESELFGHERGAFTGSRDSARGLLRAAADGTVLLDEVTEMPDFLQPKLLRVLEQRSVRPVGGIKEHPLAARIVAATNRDPEQAVQTGKLRADLFYRLCVHRIEVPPLRQRPQDIPLLIQHFLDAIAERGHVAPERFGSSSLDLLFGHDWPGNVRELRNVVEHCCATAKQRPVEAQHLPGYLRHRSASARSGTLRIATAQPLPAPDDEPAVTALAVGAETLEPLHTVERRHIERCLEAAGGNKTIAARLLGLSRHQLYSRLQRQRP